jgi:cyclic beta-1,2-glucan glucanotransferase
MGDKHIHPDARSRAWNNDVSARGLALDQELSSEAGSSPESARLRSAAESEARSWRTASLEKGHRLLKKKWSEASKSIRVALCQSGRLPAAGDVAATDELRNNSRLLEAALGNTRELLRTARDLPKIATGENKVVARAYAAVVCYLRASQFRFQESALVAFFSGIQEIYPLNLRELWALQSLMQFVLLEEIGRALRRSSNRNEHLEDMGGDAAKKSYQIPTLIAGLRALDLVSWREIREQIGKVECILREDPGGAYARMDSESRDLYLQVVHQLGRFSGTEESEIARRAIGLAHSARNEWSTDPRVRDRRSHVGYYLVDEGRSLLESQIHYRPPISERVRGAILAWPEVYYFVGIELLAFAIIAFLLIGARSPVSLIAALTLLSLPAAEAAWGAMNQLPASLLPPRVLPKLDFSEGIPRDYATMVVVPTLLLNEAYTRRMVTDLEIRFLANRDPNLYFALLTDAPDSRCRFDQSDELVSLCSNLIQALNGKYASQGDSVFFLFHRFRTFNPSEGSWMGWERKRGKLLDLNDLLRGEKDSFPVKVGNLSALPRIEYVIAVDSDTQLPRGVAHRLVATLAHPLNRAVIDPGTNTVVQGYGILQPRVGISVQSASRSLLASIYAGQTGWDLYTHAISNTYQDLFGEGTFVGKGIYEVDVFRQVLGGRFPCNSILSHDLIEGNYTRVGLVSDLEIIDDYPTHFSAYSRRKHRWVRGDWQIMLWLLPRVPDALGKRVPNLLSLLSRWKIFDNLRRSLVEVATFVLLLAGWLSLPGSPRRWTLVVVVLWLIPVYLQLVLSLLKLRSGQNLARRVKEITEDFIAGQINVFFMLAFLSHQTLVALDAIIRTIVRVSITRKNLLEWETAAEAEVESKATPVDVYLGWTPWLSVVIGTVLAISRPVALPDAAPLLVLWACAGPLARWLNGPLRPEKAKIIRQEEEFLRSATLRTWRYFRQYAAESDNGLVPDNILDIPLEVDHRISPTNLGLLLTSQLAAYELGYLTLPEFAREVERTLETAKCLPRFRGHFLNWYDTQTLEPLEPRFVSSVDSGNLACSLWTLKQGCLRAIQEPLLRGSTWQGLCDHINFLNELASNAVPGSSAARSLRKIDAQIDLLGKHENA